MEEKSLDTVKSLKTYTSVVPFQRHNIIRLIFYKSNLNFII